MSADDAMAVDGQLDAKALNRFSRQNAAFGALVCHVTLVCCAFCLCFSRLRCRPRALTTLVPRPFLQGPRRPPS